MSRLFGLSGRVALVTGATRDLAAALGPHNVGGGAPGSVKTDSALTLWEDPATLAADMGPASLGQMGTPDEIAGAAVLLAPGRCFVIDGG